MALIDITPALSADYPAWPGDVKFSAERSWTLGADCPVNVSKIELSTHAGAHADAPLHYAPDGASIDEVALEPYLGPCAVLHLIGARGVVEPDAVMAAAARIGDALPPRLLLRFYRAHPNDWDPEFPAIAPETIERLADGGVVLIGVDTQSLDQASSKTMDAHRAILRRDMRVLENLFLDAAPEGVFELIALPLKLKGLDAAPVRAVLRSWP